MKLIEAKRIVRKTIRTLFYLTMFLDLFFIIPMFFGYEVPLTISSILLFNGTVLAIIGVLKLGVKMRDFIDEVIEEERRKIALEESDYLIEKALEESISFQEDHLGIKKD